MITFVLAAAVLVGVLFLSVALDGATTAAGYTPRHCPISPSPFSRV
jgi:hypothetical protein